MTLLRIAAGIYGDNRRERPKSMKFFVMNNSTHSRQGVWKPAVDIYQYKQGWLIKMDVAGIQMKDIQIQLSGNQVTIQGIRRDWAILDGRQTYTMEIDYHRFERHIELPCCIEQARLSTQYREGMLLVNLQVEPS